MGEHIMTIWLLKMCLHPFYGIQYLVKALQ